MHLNEVFNISERIFSSLSIITKESTLLFSRRNLCVPEIHLKISECYLFLRKKKVHYICTNSVSVGTAQKDHRKRDA